MEIGKHLNRRDMKQIPPPIVKKRLNAWLAYGDKGQYWSPNDTLKAMLLSTGNSNLYKRLSEMCCRY